MKNLIKIRLRKESETNLRIYSEFRIFELSQEKYFKST